MRPLRGISLVDTLVGTALVLTIFLALTGLLLASLQVASLAKAKAGATAVANNQIELIRATEYDSVGTIGGIPAGTVPQNSTTTENGIAYGVRTFIEYVDDPADGAGSADTNSITTDYKRIKIAVTYMVKGTLRKIDLVSNYAPPSIETSTNGGTLRVSVVNAVGAPVAGATVNVVNASTSPTVNLTTFSDVNGIVLLGGAATSTQYQVYVSKIGYSSAQTYARDATNQNPNPGYLTVVKNVTTTGTFAIDVFSTLTLRTLYPIMATSTTDELEDATKLSAQTNTSIVSGFLKLTFSGGSGGYATSGSAQTIVVAPLYLRQWGTASTTLSAPNSTSVLVHVLDSGGALVPDADLAGNSAGFSVSSIPLSGLSTTTYSSLKLSFDLSTVATSTTPTVGFWALNSIVGPTPVPNVPFTITGAKTVGSTGSGSSIYKTTIATTTGATGVTSLSLEWDSYGLAVSSYDVIDACDPPPFGIQPGMIDDNTLYVGSPTANSALVSVRDNLSANVAGATVTLSRTGYSKTITTGACGTAYFGGVTSGSTYTIQISKAGYTTTTYTNVNISGLTFYLSSFP